MPLPDLISRLEPLPPDGVVRAASRLTHRAFVLVGLIVNRADLFPDQWIYVHSPGLRVGRVQNFKNWSQAMVPDPATTGLGMEYFCSEGDDIWQMADGALIDLACQELVAMELAQAGEVADGVVFRQPAAYPLYDNSYRQAVDTIQAFLATLTNLQTIGRNGMHRYNNQDHSMLTAILAVKNLHGETHDLWSVNTEPVYHETRPVPGPPRRQAQGDL
jgi:protoporphyrinogen oxidase